VHRVEKHERRADSRCLGRIEERGRDGRVERDSQLPFGLTLGRGRSDRRRGDEGTEEDSSHEPAHIELPHDFGVFTDVGAFRRSLAARQRYQAATER